MRETAMHQPPTPDPYPKVVKVTCQFCGREAPYPENHAWHGAWAKGSFEINSVSIHREKGDTFPEGGSKVTESYDCCPACWDSKIRPVLDGLLMSGETINEEESDW